ncbi:hypothetical protein PsYK624_123230 [Phanerochaete sordida]|uniref:Uncharacterized protein n=1 Tax=Phanerochaete sordida TaxID=48140 RepID=A0A9P3LI93_9APHY|nr:hypothetical protein PsYK624_123230 [Phanerochaete sordida]
MLKTIRLACLTPAGSTGPAASRTLALQVCARLGQLRKDLEVRTSRDRSSCLWSASQSSVLVAATHLLSVRRTIRSSHYQQPGPTLLERNRMAVFLEAREVHRELDWLWAERAEMAVRCNHGQECMLVILPDLAAVRSSRHSASKLRPEA